MAAMPASVSYWTYGDLRGGDLVDGQVQGGDSAVGGFGFLFREVEVVVVAGAGVDLIFPVIGHLTQGGGGLSGGLRAFRFSGGDLA